MSLLKHSVVEVRRRKASWYLNCLIKRKSSRTR